LHTRRASRHRSQTDARPPRCARQGQPGRYLIVNADGPRAGRTGPPGNHRGPRMGRRDQARASWSTCRGARSAVRAAREHPQLWRRPSREFHGGRQVPDLVDLRAVRREARTPARSVHRHDRAGPDARRFAITTFIGGPSLRRSSSSFAGIVASRCEASPGSPTSATSTGSGSMGKRICATSVRDYLISLLMEHRSRLLGARMPSQEIMTPGSIRSTTGSGGSSSSPSPMPG